jgi:hypothetical protein
MSCIAGLLNNTCIIVGGGLHGIVAGLGEAPNYNAVLYDPTKSISQRIFVIVNITVARLYYSKAIIFFNSHPPI